MAEKKVDGLTPNPSYPPDWVEITHKDVEKNTWVAPQSLSHWEARGWSQVGGSKKSAPSADSNSKGA